MTVNLLFVYYHQVLKYKQKQYGSLLNPKAGKAKTSKIQNSNNSGRPYRVNYWCVGRLRVLPGACKTSLTPTRDKGLLMKPDAVSIIIWVCLCPCV